MRLFLVGKCIQKVDLWNTQRALLMRWSKDLPEKTLIAARFRFAIAKLELMVAIVEVVLQLLSKKRSA